jgi:hypothetical protein
MRAMKPDPGLHDGVPFTDYLAWEATSVHDLLKLRRSPQHYLHDKQHPPEPTPAMRFGTAAHSWILTPTAAPEEILVTPKVDRRTKAGKEAWAAFEASAKGRIIVSEDEAHTLAKMAGAVSNSRAAMVALDSAERREVSCAWHDPDESGLLMRGRPDALGDNLIVDLKTAVDASPDSFARTAANFGYHAQAAYYLDGLRSLGYCDEQAVFLFVVVEKTPPFGVAVYALDDDAIEAGRSQYMEAWDTFRRCHETNEWHGYAAADRIETLTLPRWATR